MLHNMFLEKKFIGQKFKEYRKKAGMSQEKLAEKVGVSTRTISLIESGLQHPKFFLVVKILNLKYFPE